eukprot:366134-Chlamydomonas_euryale.AAC.9
MASNTCVDMYTIGTGAKATMQHAAVASTQYGFHTLLGKEDILKRTDNARKIACQKLPCIGWMLAQAARADKPSKHKRFSMLHPLHI